MGVGGTGVGGTGTGDSQVGINLLTGMSVRSTGVGVAAASITIDGTGGSSGAAYSTGLAVSSAPAVGST